MTTRPQFPAQDPRFAAALVRGVAAARPAAGDVGETPLLYYATDTGAVSVAHSSAWSSVGSGFAGARVYRSTTQNVPNTTLTTMSFDTVRWDHGGMFNLAQPTRLTIVEPGLYLVGHCVEFSGASDGRTRYGDVLLNGTTIITEHSGSGFGVSGNSADTVILTAAVPWRFAAGDYVEARLYQNSGGVLTTTAADAGHANSNEFYAERVG